MKYISRNKRHGIIPLTCFAKETDGKVRAFILGKWWLFKNKEKFYKHWRPALLEERPQT